MKARGSHSVFPWPVEARRKSCAVFPWPVKARRILFCFPLAGEGKGESFCFPRPVEARRKSRSFSKAGAGRSGNFGERYPWAGAVYIYHIAFISILITSLLLSFLSTLLTTQSLSPLLDTSRLERGGILLGFSFLFPFSCISYDERD